MEKKGLKGGQERKHSRKKQKVRTPDERHGEDEGGQGSPTPRLHLADKTGRRSKLGQWIQREGGPPEASQKKRVALAGSRTAATSDGAGAPPQPGTCEGRQIIDRGEGEKGLSESKKGEGNTTGKGGNEEQLTTTKETTGTGHSARLNSLERWLRGTKRPAETHPNELKTSSAETTDDNDGAKRLKAQKVTRTEVTIEKRIEDVRQPTRDKGSGGYEITEGVG